MPTGIARNLESPELISLLIENPNSVLVIEDAEDLLTSRETNLNSGISMLLNLTDGLLGESLGIQVICTFNTKIENIDKALLRKGRLMAMYDFKPLTPQKANNLLNELKADKTYTHHPMTLAEIFNTQQEDFDLSKARKQKIGFALEQSN
jgi:ATP-dependent 26S proteasome regulatory subunit